MEDARFSVIGEAAAPAIECHKNRLPYKVLENISRLTNAPYRATAWGEQLWNPIFLLRLVWMKRCSLFRGCSLVRLRSRLVFMV